MAKKIYILLFFLFLRSFSSSAANTVTITDVNFISYLQSAYGSPTIIGNQLDTIQAALKTGTLNCRGRNISNIFGIQYFKGITFLNINKNALTTFPQLKGFTNLQAIYCDSNYLTSLPALNNIASLKYISCRVNNLTVLPDLTGLSNLNVIICSNNSITQLPSLAGLSALTYFDCAENQITQLPSELSTLVNLENIFCGRNLLTALPDLTALTKLQFLFCSNNSITSLPVSSANIGLKYIRISYNKIEHLPDLSFLIAPALVDLSYNNFTFEDLLPVVKNSNYAAYKSAFNLFPQNKFGNYADTLVQNNETFNFNLNIDPPGALMGTVNTYKWYRNGILVFTNTSNTFSKSNVSPADTGTYYVVVKNNYSEFANDSIVSNNKKLTMGNCVLNSSISYSSSSISCNEGFKISLDPGAVSGAVAPYTYLVTNLNSGEIITSSSPVFSGILEGNYSFSMRDALGCEAPPVFCLLVNGSNCDPVFSPNGDGVADTYYISIPGKAKIFNTRGSLILEMTAPAYWNGLDQNGQEAPSGYYGIVIDDKATMNVTLLR